MAINKKILIDIKRRKIKDIHSFIQLYLETEQDDKNNLIVLNITDANRLINDFLESIDFLEENRIIKLIPNQKPLPKLFEKLKEGNVQHFHLLSYEKSRYNQVDISIKDMKLLKRHIKHGVISDKEYNNIIRQRLMIFIAIFIPILIFILGYIIYKS